MSESLKVGEQVRVLWSGVVYPGVVNASNAENLCTVDIPVGSFAGREKLVIGKEHLTIGFVGSDRKRLRGRLATPEERGTFPVYQAAGSAQHIDTIQGKVVAK